jgi:outer membrane protein W
MGIVRINTLLIFSVFSYSGSALALEGKTADGCTYKVINGQYLTQCPSSPAAASATVESNNTYVAPKQTDRVSSYDAVPLVSNPSAPVPSVQTTKAPVMDVAIETPSQGNQLSESREIVRKKAAGEIIDTTYAGLALGSSSLKNSTSAFGLMASLGTFIDDNFGFELGYSYSGQGLKLGLDNRGSNSSGSATGTSSRSDDVSLKSHLITGELQGHFTETFKRLRPYLGLGLGYRMASLKERSSPNYLSGGSVSGGTLSQNSFGGLASAGAKLRIDRSLYFTFSFRYFFPLATQDPQIESGGNSYGSATRLTAEDSLFTEGSQSQLLGGLILNF